MMLDDLSASLQTVFYFDYPPFFGSISSGKFPTLGNDLDLAFPDPRLFLLSDAC